MNQATSLRSLRRWLIVIGVCLVLGRLAGIRGWFVPVRITGDSMAPTLLGEHRIVTCLECGASFVVSVAEGPPADAEIVVCPNCGATRVERAGAIDRPGERVWLDQLAHWTRSIRRGELVALRDPLDARRLAIKRVVGLPGERIRVADGDVFVDARRWRKTLEELHDVAVLVHDERFRPTRSAKPLPERWRDESGWSVYHHWRCFASPLPRTSDFAVLDNDSFNQRLSRPLREATDLMLVGRMTLARGEQVLVRITLSDGLVAVILDAASGQVELRRGERDDSGDIPEAARAWKLIAAAPLPTSVVGRDVICEVAVCDGRLLVAGDRRLLLECDEGEAGGTLQVGGATPWAVAYLGDGSRLVERRILRDVYYLGPHDAQPNWEAERPLGRGEYLLLGDNSPVSIDSRHWPDSGAVGASQIVGRVLRGWREP